MNFDPDDTKMTICSRSIPFGASTIVVSVARSFATDARQISFLLGGLVRKALSVCAISAFGSCKSGVRKRMTTVDLSDR